MQKIVFIRTLIKFLIVTSTSASYVSAAPYELIDLGTLGGPDNYAFAINNVNDITGHSSGTIIPVDEVTEENPAVTCPASDGSLSLRIFCDHAYIFSGGVLTDLGDLGLIRSHGFGINNDSTVVGYSIELYDEGDSTGLSRERAFISPFGGVMEAVPYPIETEDLPVGLAARQRALDISDSRQIVGYSLIPFTVDDVPVSTERPYVYDYDSQTHTIIPLFSDEVNRTGTARAINSSGVVVGWATSEVEFNPVHALMWDPATPELSIDLGTLGGFTSEARDINDNGIIVGSSHTSILSIEFQDLGFIYDPSLATPMIAIPEFSEDDEFNQSTAYGINNNNQVVGTAQINNKFVSGMTAFLYDYNTNVLVNLNDMVDCSLNWEIKIASDINDSGVITGTGIIEGKVHSFMLMPTGDTTPTNCTALREEAEKLAKQTSSGSMGIGVLIITGFIYLWRRRKGYIFG